MRMDVSCHALGEIQSMTSSCHQYETNEVGQPTRTMIVHFLKRRLVPIAFSLARLSGSIINKLPVGTHTDILEGECSQTYVPSIHHAWNPYCFRIPCRLTRPKDGLLSAFVTDRNVIEVAIYLFRLLQSNVIFVHGIDWLTLNLSCLFRILIRWC